MAPPEWHSVRLGRWTIPVGSAAVLAAIYAALLSKNSFVEAPGFAGVDWRSSWLGPSDLCVQWSRQDASGGFDASVLHSAFSVDVNGNAYYAGATLDSYVSLVMRKISLPGGVVFQTELFEQPPLVAPAAAGRGARRRSLLGSSSAMTLVPAFPSNRALASLEQHASGVVSSLQQGRINSSLLVAQNASSFVTAFSSVALLSLTDGDCVWGSSFVNPTNPAAAAQAQCAVPALPGLPRGLLLYAQAVGAAQFAALTGGPGSWPVYFGRRRQLTRGNGGRVMRTASSSNALLESCASPLLLLGRLPGAASAGGDVVQLHAFALKFPCSGVSRACGADCVRTGSDPLLVLLPCAITRTLPRRLRGRMTRGRAVLSVPRHSSRLGSRTYLSSRRPIPPPPRLQPSPGTTRELPRSWVLRSGTRRGWLLRQFLSQWPRPSMARRQLRVAQMALRLGTFSL